MSTRQIPLTYEGILEMFRETKLMIQEVTLQMKETDRRIEETAEQLKKTQKLVGNLSSSIGRIVENMVKGNIVEKFQNLGYDVNNCYPKPFKNKDLGIVGDIDLFLDEGDTAILIEVKTTLETADVREHIERIEKYRRYVDARGNGDKQRLIGAVAGAVVKGEAAQFAQENGMYVIVQSGEAVEIIESPEGFRAKEW